MGCQEAILPTCLNYTTGWRTEIFHNPFFYKMPFSGDPGVAPRGGRAQDICLLKSRRCSRRGARGQREWEAQEAIMRKQALGGSNARTWRGEEGPQKYQQPPHKSSSVLTKQKNKNSLHSHTFGSFNSTQMHHHHSASPSIPWRTKTKIKN